MKYIFYGWNPLATEERPAHVQVWKGSNELELACGVNWQAQNNEWRVEYSRRKTHLKVSKE
jgi:hypothetical protein